MLAHLHIRDFAIMEELELDLRPGFTVITGETGAGKSILIDALVLLLGGRASGELVRGGVEEALVEALFLLEPGSPIPARMAALGLPFDQTTGELVIRRVLCRNGRHRAFVNGSPVTASMLRDIASELVDIASQHEHQSLLRADAARQALDAFAGLQEEVRAVGQAYRELATLRGELEKLQLAARERESRLDYLRFQLEEIDGLSLRPGEEQALRQERERLRHAERLVEGGARALAGLYEDDDSVVSRLGTVVSLLEPLQRVDAALSPVLDRLADAQVAIEDAAAELRSYTGGLELDPARMSEVEERLHALEHLLRKHGPTLEQVLVRRDEMAAEASLLAGAHVRLGELQEEVGRATEHLAAGARHLSAARRRAAASFGERVERELAMLGMPQARFAVALQPLPEPGEAGADAVELLFGPNPGEDSRPLRRIASGGELSRVMLAIKRVVTASDPVPTYLYDEVDSGVSGPVAEAIGRLLCDSARQHQVLCITHHPQLAAQGGQHLRVSKAVRGEDGRTVSRVEELGAAERLEELARMLGGAVVTEATRQHARELLGQLG